MTTSMLWMLRRFLEVAAIVSVQTVLGILSDFLCIEMDWKRGSKRDGLLLLLLLLLLLCEPTQHKRHAFNGQMSRLDSPLNESNGGSHTGPRGKRTTFGDR